MPTGSAPHRDPWGRNTGIAPRYGRRRRRPPHWHDRCVAQGPNSGARIRENTMDRRTVLKGMGAAGLISAAGFPAPAISQGAATRTLRFVPQANLANFDPIWGTQYVVRNASAMVWDTLYGVDEELQPQRQMVEAEEVSSDGLTWTFRLRPGLKFHDGEPVLAKDVAASLNRWAARDQMGLLIKTIQQDLAPV